MTVVTPESAGKVARHATCMCITCKESVVSVVFAMKKEISNEEISHQCDQDWLLEGSVLDEPLVWNNRDRHGSC
jgi:hypothetical protein